MVTVRQVSAPPPSLRKSVDEAMRFLFYDRITEIKKSQCVAGVKTFALSEEFHRGHFTKLALVPGIILMEAMAQLLGWLIIYSHDFKLSAIMSLVEKVEVSPRLRPGFEAHIRCEIISTSSTDSLGRAWVTSGGDIVASAERIIYSHFRQVDPAQLAELFRYYSGLRG